MQDNIVNSFRHFAEQKLRIHGNELRTRYRNQKPDPATMRDAYYQHRIIFENELKQERMNLTTDEQNEWIKAELELMQDDYLGRLTLDSVELS